MSVLIFKTHGSEGVTLTACLRIEHLHQGALLNHAKVLGQATNCEGNTMTMPLLQPEMSREGELIGSEHTGTLMQWLSALR